MSTDIEKSRGTIFLGLGFVVLLISIGSLFQSLPVSLQLKVVTTDLVRSLGGVLAGLVLVSSGFAASRKKKEADPDRQRTTRGKRP
jgi:hypothetical protein